MNKKLSLMAMILAVRMQSEDKKRIEFLLEQIMVLLEVVERNNCKLQDGDRMRLAFKGRFIGWSILQEVSQIVTPETIYRWYRQMIAEKYTPKRRGRREYKMKAIKNLVLRFATENRNWGYGKIQGALKALGFNVCRNSIGKILKENGLQPSPARNKGWGWVKFINSIKVAASAMDFFDVEVLTLRGLVRYKVHFIIDIATRKVEVTRICCQWSEQEMLQIARNVTDCFDGCLKDKKYLIMDGDSLFTPKFQQMLIDSGLTPKVIPPGAPMLNGYAESFVGKIRNECLNNFIFVGEKMVHKVVSEYVEYYNHERPHQGIENNIINPDPEVFKNEGSVACREVPRYFEWNEI